GVRLAVELEVHGENTAGVGRVLGVVGDRTDARVREDGDVELGRLERVGVETEVGGEPGHGAAPGARRMGSRYRPSRRRELIAGKKTAPGGRGGVRAPGAVWG